MRLSVGFNIRHKDTGKVLLSSGCKIGYANLDCAKLKNVDMSDTDLTYVSLRYAKLKNVDMSDTDLEYTDLEYANLDYTELKNINLFKSNARGASFRFSTFKNINLEGAYLEGAYLGGAKGIRSFSIGEYNRKCFAVLHDDCVMFQLGCFWGNTEEAIRAVRAKYGTNSTYEKLINIYTEDLKDK